MNRDRFVTKARKMLVRRQLRETHFRAAAFGEPAWEVLLHLYTSGDHQSLARLIKVTKAKGKSLHRWLGYLKCGDLLNLGSTNDNGTDATLRLSQTAQQKLDDYFMALSELEA